jgi:hypothetical protein
LTYLILKIDTKLYFKEIIKICIINNNQQIQSNKEIMIINYQMYKIVEKRKELQSKKKEKIDYFYLKLDFFNT